MGKACKESQQSEKSLWSAARAPLTRGIPTPPAWHPALMDGLEHPCGPATGCVMDSQYNQHRFSRVQKEEKCLPHFLLKSLQIYAVSGGKASLGELKHSWVGKQYWKGWISPKQYPLIRQVHRQNSLNAPSSVALVLLLLIALVHWCYYETN